MDKVGKDIKSEDLHEMSCRAIRLFGWVCWGNDTRVRMVTDVEVSMLADFWISHREGISVWTREYLRAYCLDNNIRRATMTERIRVLRKRGGYIEGSISQRDGIVLPPLGFCPSFSAFMDRAVNPAGVEICFRCSLM